MNKKKKLDGYKLRLLRNKQDKLAEGLENASRTRLERSVSAKKGRKGTD